MYFTDDSLLPENQPPLIITAAPYGPIWLPSDYPEDIPLTWEQQAQKALDCYNAGATLLHIHVCAPKTGMARELGRDIATAEQTHRILKIGTWYRSVEETLFNVGLPPNRPEGQQGFMVYDTDGKIPQAARTDQASTLIL